jgi:hypothetical protein
MARERGLNRRKDSRFWWIGLVLLDGRRVCQSTGCINLTQSGTSLPELIELGGWKSYEMVLRYAHLAPEKLSFVAGRIERQASKLLEEAPRLKKVAKNTTFSLRSVHRCTVRHFDKKRARTDSNRRPPGSK